MGGIAAHGIAQPIRRKADESRGQHDEREGDGEKEQRDESHRRDHDRKPRFERAAADTQHGFDDDGEHRRLEAEEQAGDEAHIAPDDVDPAERHQGDDARHDEQHAGDNAAARLVHQPADIDGELLRLGPRQKMAVVQRMQKARFGNPAPFFDDDAMHDRDLSGRAAEAEQGDAQPDLERFAEADAMRRHGLVRRISAQPRGWSRSCATSGRRRPVMRFANGIARPTIKRIIEREAGVELHKIVLVHARQAKRCRKQTGGLRREIETCRVGGAHDEGQAIERLAVQAEFLDHHIEGAELAAVAPEYRPRYRTALPEIGRRHPPPRPGQRTGTRPRDRRSGG